MKKYIKYALLATVSLTAFSCDGYLDQMPNNALPSKEAITNYKDAQTALTGVYNGLQYTDYTGCLMVYYGDVLGDYLQVTEPSQRGASLYEMNYTAAISSSIWLTPYNGIRMANNLITAIKDGKVADATNDKVSGVLAEALTMRALNHFNLVRVYGHPYTKDNGASLGVPIELVAADPQNKPGRSTVAQVYSAIVTDLTDAITAFTTAGATAKALANGYFNVWSAKALLARVYLYQGANDLAFATAQDVIENSPYKLVSNEDYAASWVYEATSSTNTEIMFQIINTSTDNGDREGIGYLMSEDGYDSFIVSKKLRDIMDTRPDDVRNEVMIKSVDPNHIKAYGEAGVWVRKYLPLNNDARISNIPLLRLSETYLIAAEAGLKSATADKAAAAQYLNDIAKRNPAGGNIALTIDNVLLEKGIEMVGEGERFFDLMRNNVKSDRANRWSYIMPNLSSVSFDNSYFRIVLPIPLDEMNVNPSMKGQQNVGY